MHCGCPRCALVQIAPVLIVILVRMLTAPDAKKARKAASKQRGSIQLAALQSATIAQHAAAPQEEANVPRALRALVSGSGAGGGAATSPDEIVLSAAEPALMLIPAQGLPPPLPAAHHAGGLSDRSVLADMPDTLRGFSSEAQSPGIDPMPDGSLPELEQGRPATYTLHSPLDA